MKIVILRSERRRPGRRPTGPYVQQFDTVYAGRVIGNLTGEPGFCSACGPDCNACRRGYRRRFRANIAAVVGLPAALPYLLEHPARRVPRSIPPHDILLAVNIHEQILVEILKRSGKWGTRGVVVPLEAPDWISGSAREQASAVCGESGVEIAFPKPFCSFDPPAGSALATFRRRFHIGKPDVRLEIRNRRIEKAHVEVSAACGATYYVARWLEGRHIDEDLRHEVVSKRMHSYPCTASMKWDDELGDTPLHVAGQAHYEILAPLETPAPEEPGMVRSPAGRMVQKPVPPSDNLASVERARQLILADVAVNQGVSLAGLKRKRQVPPAALHTALLLLKREGRIRVDGQRIRKA
ncbi:MAG: DUF166 family protein [Planctomycetota bacterium]